MKVFRSLFTEKGQWASFVARARASMRPPVQMILSGVLFLSAPSGLASITIYTNSDFISASKALGGQQVHLSFTPPYEALGFGYYGWTASVSNVTFVGRINVISFTGGGGWVNNYDGDYPLAIRFPTGAKAFSASFSSWLPSPPYSSFPATVTTDLGDVIQFTAWPHPAYVCIMFTSTTSFYELTYNDGGLYNNMYHEELIGDIDLVLNPPPNLEVARGTGARVDIRVNGSQGQTVVVETSTNLVEWSAIATNTLTTDRWVYSQNQTAADSTRYYRTLLR